MGEGNTIKGHYVIDVLDANGNVQDNYESNFDIPNTNYENGYVIYGDTNDGGITLSGYIDDNTINANQGLSNRETKWGGFKLIIQSSNPTTAKWEVERPYGLRLDSEPPSYSIPTDIIMIKQ